MTENFLKIFVPAAIAFLFGIVLTPILSRQFYRYRLWKRTSRQDQDTDMGTEFGKIHNAAAETSTPRVGGIIIWLSVLLTVALMWITAKIAPGGLMEKYDILSKSQTVLPFAALLIGAVAGLGEDLLEISSRVRKYFEHGLPKRVILLGVAAIGLVFALWFFFKLDVSSVVVPFVGEVELGWVFIPFFIVVMLGTFSSRIIDGVDGLAGGVMASIYASYSLIAYMQNQLDIAAFCAVVTMGIMVFLWFNTPPARFYMGETGMLALSLSLAVVAFLTDAVLLLLVIGFPLVITSLSGALQMGYWQLTKKRLFRIAPFHNYLLVRGWSRPKITMRYWIISVFCGLMGIVISLLG